MTRAAFDMKAPISTAAGRGIPEQLFARDGYDEIHDRFPAAERGAVRAVARIQCWPKRERSLRVVLLNRFFWPDHSATAQLLTDLAEHLSREGIEVRVIATSRPNGADAGTLPRLQTRAGITIRRVPSSALCLPGLAGRLAEYLTFYCTATGTLFAEVRRGDTVVVKTDPPLICLLGWMVARLKGARVVNWCQDLFPEVAAALGLRFVNRPIAWPLRKLRNVALRGAEFNVAISEEMAARLCEEGVSPGRITVIDNWADGAIIRPVAHEHNELRRQWGLGSRFVVGYSGNFGRAHDPDPVIRLMRLLDHRDDTAFLFIGAGPSHARLRAAVTEHGLRNVHFKEHQPRERLAESLSAPNVHIVTLRPECEGLVFPSKLYAALAAGRPILFIGDPQGSVARVLATTGAGVSVDGRCAEELVGALETLRIEAESRGAAARQAFDRRFRKELALASWSAQLAAVATRTAPSRHDGLAPARGKGPVHASERSDDKLGSGYQCVSCGFVGVSRL